LAQFITTIYSLFWPSSTTAILDALLAAIWLFWSNNSDKNWHKNCKNREVILTTYKTSLPSVPDGEYIVITYKTRFYKKKIHQSLRFRWDRNQTKYYFFVCFKFAKKPILKIFLDIVLE